MKWMTAAVLSSLLLSGCASIPSVPEARARAAWEGRPAREVLEHFGVPNGFAIAPEKQWVVLVYQADTSYVSREALGTFTGPSGGQIVHQEYWGDVYHPKNCELRVALNRAKMVEFFAVRGGNCNSIKMMPTKPRQQDAAG